MTKECPTCGVAMDTDTLSGVDSRGIEQFQSEQTCPECNTTVTEFGEVITADEKQRRIEAWGQR